MNKEILYSLFFLLALGPATSQDSLDADYFKIHGGISVKLDKASDYTRIRTHRGITPDHGFSPQQPLLYVNERGYRFLKRQSIPFEIKTPEKSLLKMLSMDEWLLLRDSSSCLPVIDFYPTYDTYEAILTALASDYPDICSLVNLGTLNSGRKILALKIGADRVDPSSPAVLLTSTMHGDETAGFPLLIQLADYLLCGYGTDPEVSSIVDNIVVYINPLANPDGTYRSGNHTVSGAIRYNSSFADLNRNFPDPEDGPHPDGRNYQEETRIFMDFADSVDIHLAVNLHSGVEVANYPWDTFEKEHADDAWWRDICRDYADTVHFHAQDSTYFRDFDNGITNGFAWYEVQGGRQDYMTYFKRSREFTLELTTKKLLDTEDLPAVWEAHKYALINYIKEAGYGIHGTVKDCVSGLPVEAEIIIPGHDKDNSSVFSSSDHGTFYRYLAPGHYSLQVLAEGYEPLGHEVTVFSNTLTHVSFEICPDVSSSLSDYPDMISFQMQGNLLVPGDGPALDLEVFDLTGRKVFEMPGLKHSVDLAQGNNSGFYIVRLSRNRTEVSFPLFIK